MAAAVRNAAISPDGRFVATASDDHTARVWEAATGKEYVTLRGHSGPVNTVAFSPDGNSVLTSSEDGTARLWRVDPLVVATTRMPRALTADEIRRFNVPQVESK